MERKSVNYQKANYVQREAIDVPYLSGSRCICPSLLLFPENFHFLFLFVFSIFVFFVSFLLGSFFPVILPIFFAILVFIFCPSVLLSAKKCFLFFCDYSIFIFPPPPRIDRCSVRMYEKDALLLFHILVALQLH